MPGFPVLHYLLELAQILTYVTDFFQDTLINITNSNIPGFFQVNES